MFRKIDDFLLIWKHESNSTLSILHALTDESLDKKVYEEGWSLGKLAWHLVKTLNEMVGKTGLQFAGTPYDAPEPNDAKSITAAYKEASESMVHAIKEHWTDETLVEEYDMYGDNWTVATILQILVSHQTHHRGQMTVLMRQAGLVVPGMYGPSKEEWLAFGEEALE